MHAYTAGRVVGSENEELIIAVNNLTDKSFAEFDISSNNKIVNNVDQPSISDFFIRIDYNFIQRFLSLMRVIQVLPTSSH